MEKQIALNAKGVKYTADLLNTVIPFIYKEFIEQVETHSEYEWLLNQCHLDRFKMLLEDDEHWEQLASLKELNVHRVNVQENSSNSYCFYVIYPNVELLFENGDKPVGLLSSQLIKSLDKLASFLKNKAKAEFNPDQMDINFLIMSARSDYSESDISQKRKIYLKVGLVLYLDLAYVKE